MNNVINRYEVKYYISFDTFNKLYNNLKDYLVRDTYYKETIYNVFFDNESMDFINNSIDKPKFKEKIRLRIYSNDLNKCFFEIKKKFNGLSNKRRILIKYNDYLSYMKGNYKCVDLIFKEIDYCIKKYNLKPKIKVVYDRYAYNIDDIRITFDSNIRYSVKDFTVKGKCISYMNNGYIMEIKSNSSIPLWLSEKLNKLNIYPIPYSKVGNICKEVFDV